ncbi:MAG: 3-deoxy-7-phosphoheptulonate synthase [Spartobacteria bacterium]|nr:3-deoxy-7-phosphoheptulonate synthase [Spartobacteria bacterium]
MIIILKPRPTEQEVAHVEARVRELGYEPHTLRGEVRTVIAAIGDETTHASLESLISNSFVDRVMPVQQKYKLISRETHPEDFVVDVGGVPVGGDAFCVIAGPCAVESQEQILETAEFVKKCGATMLRGGAFKPRTSPYDFQGIGVEALKMMKHARDVTGLPIVTEVVRESTVSVVAEYADMLQIGARNALNYSLLETVAETGKPILLKRGLAATVTEWLLAAEYIVKKGNRNVILCERGIRTFETSTRNMLDVGAVAIAKQETCLPVIVDPSHAAGRVGLVTPLAKAAIAAGADGLIVEAHPCPEQALSDQAQQLNAKQFETFITAIRPYIGLNEQTFG